MTTFLILNIIYGVSKVYLVLGPSLDFTKRRITLFSLLWRSGMHSFYWTLEPPQLTDLFITLFHNEWYQRSWNTGWVIAKWATLIDFYWVRKQSLSNFIYTCHFKSQILIWNKNQRNKREKLNFFWRDQKQICMNPF